MLSMQGNSINKFYYHFLDYQVVISLTYFSYKHNGVCTSTFEHSEQASPISEGVVEI
jgi:hypothetical protein